MLDIRQLVASLWWGSLQRPIRMILVRLLDRDKIIRLGPLRGRKFNGNYSQLLGIYEMKVEHSIRDNLLSGDIFYDIGANYGYFSLLGAFICGPTGHVYSFEPVPSNIQRIQQNTQGFVNCTVVSKAVSDTTGISHIVVGDGVNAVITDGAQENSIPVDLIALDDFVQQNPIPKLIKIDVEGAEYKVMQGARQLLSSPNAPAFIIELHDQENDRLVTAELIKNEFTVTPILSRFRKKRDYPHHVFAQKKL
ncbi:MAG: FkbM family methyltransferase [Anaerolineae bacterium]|nr:FkbM family methyltransferase [Anaerolineae bacterium]